MNMYIEFGFHQSVLLHTYNELNKDKRQYMLDKNILTKLMK